MNPRSSIAAADLLQRLGLVTRVDVAVAQHTAGEPLDRLGQPPVALAEPLERRRSTGCEDRAAELVDRQAIGHLDQVTILGLPARPAVVMEVGMAVDHPGRSVRFVRRTSRPEPGRGPQGRDRRG